MHSRTAKVGLGPGALVHVSEHKHPHTHIRVLDYTAHEVVERELSDIRDCHDLQKKDSVTWVDVTGISDASMIEKIGEQFGLHILIMEDIMNSSSRPKVEVAENYTFVTLKMLEYPSGGRNLNIEQFSLVIGDNFLITFQERPGDSFDSVRNRIRSARGLVRTKDTYYLAYLLLDVIIDNYIAVSEHYATDISELEALVLRKPTELTLHRILSLRKDLLDFKRSVDPLKEVINLLRHEVEDRNAKYYRDLYDHIIFESENLAMYREMLVNLLDLYHSSLSYKMNAVMKVLTIITTIFVPLTFIVGIYGMNFRYMPELEWRYGYFMVLGFMAVLVIGMLIYFQRKRWL